MLKPYTLFTPPFDSVSGGVRVMYGLYGHLLAKGQIAHLNAKFNHSDCVAIYPEIEHGNPAEAFTVVRYILNIPGVVDAIYSDGSFKKGPTKFNDDDILYYFSRLFGETDEKHYMFLPILNLHLFKDQKKLRNKTCYFVGKGFDLTLDKHPKDAILVDRELAQDQQALADLLNETDALYCYDPVTAMLELARLNGCRIVQIPSIYSREEFSKYEPTMNGISWGEDEGIKLDYEKFRNHYANMIKQFSEKLDFFIEETQR
jgi:hypothetical protein